MQRCHLKPPIVPNPKCRIRKITLWICRSPLFRKWKIAKLPQRPEGDRDRRQLRHWPLDCVGPRARWRQRLCQLCRRRRQSPKRWWTKPARTWPHSVCIQSRFSSEDDVAKMFEAVRDEFGTVDILVNNAGLQSDASFDQMTLAQMEQSDRMVNLTGQFLCAREAVREFKARGVRPEISCCAERSSASARSTK